MVESPRRRRTSVASRIVCCIYRFTFFRTFRKRSAAAGLVFANRPPACQRSLFPLWGKQCRQPFRIVVLSDLFEPNFTLSSQSELWSVGYMVLLILVVACSLLMLIQRRDPIASVDNRASIAALNISMNAAPAWHERISWVGLAFVPSGLLVSVTNHISTDVAAVPFLWVLPLALFLLTFIITFQKRPIIKHPWMLAVQPTAIIVLVIPITLPISIILPKMSSNWLLVLAIHLLAFFIMAMVCHGELIRRRPSVKNLTGFYLWMSFGGMLGGLFAGLMAPQIFSSIVEYPLFAIASLLARPGIWKKNEKRWSVEIFLGLIQSL